MSADLASLVIKESVERNGIDPAKLDDVILGCGYPSGENPAIGRLVGLKADLCTTRAEHNLDRPEGIYPAPRELAVDAFGIWPYDRNAATAFFTPVSARYEQGASC